jgi:hypothetical protein
MRLLAGSNATAPLADTKMAKVGVPLALIVVVTLLPIAEMHCPVCGLVWHRLIVSGRLAVPVLA